jgi:NADH-quinone oxidoreductase subunit G
MEADTVLIIGTHLSDENPVIDYIVRRISASRRMNVIIASPRAMKLDSSANIVLRHNVASENAVLTSIVIGLNEGKLADTLKSMHEAQLDANVKASGVSADLISTAVNRLAASSSVAIIAGTEFLRYPEGISGLGLPKTFSSPRARKSLSCRSSTARTRGARGDGCPRFGPGYLERAGARHRRHAGRGHEG